MYVFETLAFLLSPPVPLPPPLFSQDGIEVDGGDSGGAEVAVPTGDAVGVGPDGSSVDPDPDPSVSAEPPPPPQVASDNDAAVEVRSLYICYQ